MRRQRQPGKQWGWTGVLPVLAYFIASAAMNSVMAASDAPGMETVRITTLYDENFGNSKGDAVRGKQVAAQMCATCHGSDGNAVSNAFPSLSAQLPNYLASQLVLYKMEKRRSPIMMPIAKNLSTDDMLDVATYYSRQAPAAPHRSTQAELLAQGEKLYKGGDVERGIPACAWCHGPSGSSSSPIFPRIGGQSPAYLEAVLGILKTKFFYAQEAYVMKAVLANMNQEDIKAVSEYVSTIPSAGLESSR